MLIGPDCKVSFEFKRYGLMISAFSKFMNDDFAAAADRPAMGWSIDVGGPANCVFAIASRSLSGGKSKSDG